MSDKPKSLAKYAVATGVSYQAKDGGWSDNFKGLAKKAVGTKHSYQAKDGGRWTSPNAPADIIGLEFAQLAGNKDSRG